MKIVVTGATGNVGTSVVEVLAADDRVTEIVGIARRLPPSDQAKTRWVPADIAAEDLAPIFAGAAAVIHLAWLIQPSRDEAETNRVNVLGSRRVFQAAASAGVGALVHASSVGAYSPGPKDRAVDESWPTAGIETSFYSRHKGPNSAGRPPAPRRRLCSSSSRACASPQALTRRPWRPPRVARFGRELLTGVGRRNP